MSCHGTGKLENKLSMNCEKICENCGDIYFKKETDNSRNWKNRKYCSLKCASAKKKGKYPTFRGCNTTHCRSGLHEWIEENIIIDSKGRKCCKLCSEIAKQKRPKYIHPDPERQKRERKNNQLKFFYKITLEDYNKMFKEQEGKCKICNKSVDEFKKGLVVDHCHETGKIRGLLCTNCNTGIGSLGDNIYILQRSIEYLKGTLN